jgi:RNA polymerase sigma-70 factor (TIGR02943 family)
MRSGTESTEKRTLCAAPTSPARSGKTPAVEALGAEVRASTPCLNWTLGADVLYYAERTWRQSSAFFFPMNASPRTSKLDPSTWVDEHGDVLYRFALLRVKDPHVAEDLVQDTFISALEGLDTFKGDSSERTWLVGILKHKILDHFRKNSREIVSTDLGTIDGESDDETFNRWEQWRRPPSSWRDSPDNLLENKEFWRVFVRCLEGLPESFRRAFALREIDGLNTEEVCKILEVTTTNLWVMLHRARARLRNCLDDNWFREARSGAGRAPRTSG